MKKKIIWSVVAVLIIIAVIIGILYYTTDLFKTPEQLFYKHLAVDSTFLGETTYADAMQQMKNELETSRESTGEITAKITSTDTSVQEASEVLERGKITYNMKNVGAEKKMQGDITLNYDGKDIVTVNLLQNQDQYGIKIEEAYDKYVSVENNNLKALFEKLGADAADIPDKIETIDYYELLNIDEATLKHIKDTYSETIKQNIPEESYSVEKNVTVKVEDTDVTTNAYKLTLTQEQVKTILIKLLETLKTDDTTLDLIINKYNVLMQPYVALGVTMNTELTKDGIVEGIEDAIQEFNNMSATSETALEVIAYGIKDNRTKIVIDAVENSESVAKFEMDMTKADKDKAAKMTCTSEDFTMTMKTIENEEKTEANILISADETSMEMNMSVNNDNVSEATMKIASDGTTMEINVKDELKSTENVTVDAFTSENSVKLNDMTQNEFVTLVQTIYTNVMSALPQKAQLLGINL